MIAEARRNGNLLDLRVVEMEKTQNDIASRMVVTCVPRYLPTLVGSGVFGSHEVFSVMVIACSQVVPKRTRQRDQAEVKVWMDGMAGW